MESQQPSSSVKLPLILGVLMLIIALVAGAYYLGVRQTAPEKTSIVPTGITATATSAPLPSVPPTVSPETIPGRKTFTSNKLGLTFSYLESNNSGFQTITVKEAGNKICVTYDVNDANCSKGQYVEVFQKSPADTIEQAITKRFLANYSSNECYALKDNRYSNLNYPASYETAVISFPKPTNTDGPWWEIGSKCPQTYTESNGMAYFLEDKNHPDKLLFFSIGQYAIDAGNNKTWNQTLQFN